MTPVHRIVASLMIIGPLTAAPAASADQPARKTKAEAIAAKINGYFERYWKTEEIQPAGEVSDARLLRRLYLDLAGKIPPVSEARKFRASKDPKKRERKVEELLQSAGYVSHFTNVWRDTWLPDSPTVNASPGIQRTFEDWLRTRLAVNAPYDQMVREIVTADAAGANGGTGPSAISFYAARQRKPEELAAATSRLFLGVSLECAQCHSHPFAVWSRTQFWQYAAFFSNARQANGKIESQLLIPGTSRTVQAQFLDDAEPDWKGNASTRTVLARWMTNPKNKLFAKAIVNQLWIQLLGEGLAESHYDLSDDNVHQELLDALADEVIANGYDLQLLIRAIVISRPYQLTSNESHASQKKPRSFAKWTVKGLSAEQLYDSVVQATGAREPAAPQQNGTFRPLAVGPRAQFLEAFKSQQRAHEQSTSILQALALMNGGFAHQITRPGGEGTLAAVTDAPFLTTSERIEALYLAALSRMPRPTEAARMLKHVTAGGPSGNQKQALSDVFWALLNCSEFMLNH